MQKETNKNTRAKPVTATHHTVLYGKLLKGGNAALWAECGHGGPCHILKCIGFLWNRIYAKAYVTKLAKLYFS